MELIGKKKKKNSAENYVFFRIFFKGSACVLSWRKKKIDNYIIIFVKQPRKTNKNKLS